MIRHFEKAVADIAANTFLNSITVITIAFSILIVSAFGLLMLNMSDFLNIWKSGIRVMVYLKENCNEQNRLKLEKAIRSVPGVSDLKWISKTEGLSRLKEQMKNQPSFLADLKDNPLPDAFEISLDPSHQHPDPISRIAAIVQKMERVDEVEYGQAWLGRFAGIIGLLQMAGYAFGGLFFMAGVFIVANTIRLVLYSKRDEIEIMRLIGATDGFISAPFFIQGSIQGAAGGLLGTGLLYLVFSFISLKVKGYEIVGPVSIRFFSPEILFGIIGSGVLAGLMGCYFSLRQFLKY